MFIYNSLDYPTPPPDSGSPLIYNSTLIKGEALLL
jgi:hypothetical protein